MKESPLGSLVNTSSKILDKDKQRTGGKTVQDFIFSKITNGPIMLVLHYFKLERLDKNKQSSLLGPYSLCHMMGHLR